MTASKRTADKPAKTTEWLVYKLRGPRATYLGTVNAASREEAIAVAAMEFSVPARRILVQQMGAAE